MQNKTADIEANVIPFLLMLDAARDTGVSRVLFFSSGGTIYGLPRSLPVREDHETNPISPYGITKLAAEKYLKMYRELYGLEYVIFRPSVPYGPRQLPNREQGVVSVFTYRALKGDPITIWGDGQTLRDYFYVKDMVPSLIAAMDLPSERSMTFNLAGPTGYTLLELVQTIEDVLGVKIKVEYRDARSFDVPRIHLDCSAAKERLGFEPTTILQEGVRKTATWLEELIWREG